MTRTPEDAQRILAQLRKPVSATRRRVLENLAKTPSLQCDLATKLDLAPSTVNHHVKQLRSDELLQAQRGNGGMLLLPSKFGETILRQLRDP